jgi:hypothetical protein
VVESYSTLQDDPSQHIPDILQRISEQIAFSSNHSHIINTGLSTVPVAWSPSPSAPTTSSIWINVMWFLSLAFALIAAFTVIVVLQWLRYYERFPLMETRARVRLRQQRFIGLRKWMVPQVISGVSLLLELSLFLFLAGLCTLIWGANRKVAAPIAVVVCLFLAAYTCTAVLPMITADCPYKSPLSSAIYSIMHTWGPTSINLYSSSQGWMWPREMTTRDVGAIDAVAIDWTVAALSADNAEPILPCYLDIYTPERALFEWLSRLSNQSLEEAIRIARACTERGRIWWHERARYPTEWMHGKDGAAIMLPLAMEHVLLYGSKCSISYRELLMLAHHLFRNEELYVKLVFLVVNSIGPFAPMDDIYFISERLNERFKDPKISPSGLIDGLS